MGALETSIAAAAATSQTLLTERARLDTALLRLFAATGDFQTVVSVTQGALRHLAAEIQKKGGDTKGWVG